jgi:hypothetical protein|tara:strand:+ start:825 stop:1286 length:462 start_codon:yes stop_codon:yes gene_type:complete
MAHFAKISENNEVLTVLVLDNKDTQNAEGVEVESIGQAYLEKHNNWPADKWIQTSYNTVNNTHLLDGTAFRGNYAGIGFTWDEVNEIFWAPKPYGSWIKNTLTASWKSPIGDAPVFTEEQLSQKQSGLYYWMYDWNETNQTWDLVDKTVLPEN